jgi:hypothetical protein
VAKNGQIELRAARGRGSRGRKGHSPSGCSILVYYMCLTTGTIRPPKPPFMVSPQAP